MPVTMRMVYLVAALGGGALLALQILMSLLGAGHDGDIDHDFGHDVGHSGDHGGGHGSGGLTFSFRAVVAFLTFFGIAGMAASTAGFGNTATLLTAFFTGLAAFWLVGFVMLQFGKLRASGTVDINNAVGVEGKIYLSVPESGGGEGAVTVALQGRTMQFKAISKDRGMKTGALCRVVAVRSNDTLEVEPLRVSEESP